MLVNLTRLASQIKPLAGNLWKPCLVRYIFNQYVAVHEAHNFSFLRLSR